MKIFTTGKRREILINQSEITKVLEVLTLDEFGNVSWDPRAGIAIGNCGWAKAPECWFIRFNTTDENWNKILKELVKREITINPETTGY